MEARALELEALARSSSGGEALGHAIGAAEAFMKAASEASDPAEKVRLKRRCEQAIGFAERLKTTPNPVAAAGRGRGRGPVPVLAPAASRSNSAPVLPRRGYSPLSVSPAPASPAVASKPLPPVQSRRLPPGEEAIILRSSRLHGCLFPPWDAAPASEFFQLSASGGSLYSDPSEFALSDRQLDIFAGWKRPSEMFSSASSSGSEDGEGAVAESRPALMHPSRESDLVQDITTDCSVVASLCAAMKHLVHTRKDATAKAKAQDPPLLSGLMYPFDPSSSAPLLSENGRYVFRMHFNGCCRQVTIDDRLPASRTSRTLFVVDRRNPQLIWPALMEKAYLKVRGGYDFPGSNSGTDLWVLTGWIPEQIFLHADDVELDQTWSRVRRAYQFGDVVVTLGTGRLSPEEEETLGLAGEHDYAVMDLRDDNGSRRMLVKNPWCDGLVWKGVGSSAVPEPAKPAPPALRRGEEGELGVAKENEGEETEEEEKESMTGTFWIAFEDVVQNFESLYLNWNPALFTHRQDHHFAWTMPDAATANSFAPNPQYSVCAAADGALWVLLSRHLQDGELQIARSRLSASSSLRQTAPASTSSPTGAPQDDFSSSLGFMSLYVFGGTGGSRVQLPDRPRPLHRSHFVDSPQTLVRFEARRGERYTLAVAQASLPLMRYSFTLSFFSRCALEVAKAPAEHARTESLSGAWTRRSAGGNSAEPTYLCNPQYALRVTSPASLSLLLCADNPDLPVHVDLIFGGGGAAATARDIVASSGEYRRGSALCTVSPSSPASAAAGGSPLLQPGPYTVVLSTFEPGQLASYTLEVGSSSAVPVTISSAPRTGAAAGRLRTALAPVPDVGIHIASTAGGHSGGRSSSQGSVHHRRHRAPLIVSRLTRVSVSAAPRSGGLDAVRVALEAGAATGSRRRVLAVSHGGEGDFGDAASGARTAEVDVDPELARREGGLWVVVEQAGSAAAASAAVGVGARASAVTAGSATLLEVFSDNPIRVGPWEYVNE